MQVTVTQKDIDEGTRRNCGACPIALALKRAGCTAVEVAVDGPYVSFLGEPEGSVRGAWKLYTLPFEAMRFITAFDEKEPVWPISFEMQSYRTEEN